MSTVPPFYDLFKFRHAKSSISRASFPVLSIMQFIAETGIMSVFDTQNLPSKKEERRQLNEMAYRDLDWNRNASI